MVSPADFRAFDADHRPPSFFLRFDLLNLLNHGPALGLGEQNEAADCDDAQDEEDVEGVEAVSSHKTKAKWAKCGCQSAEGRNYAHTDGSDPSRIQLTYIDLEEAEEERDAATEDKDHY